MGRLGVLRRALRCALLLGAWCPAGASLAEDGITVYYNDRPPYLMLGKDGSVHGLTATPALQAFQAAGIATTWQRAPTNRQLVLLQEGGQRCAVGWFRNAARERFARFSKAIYRDLPPVALARADLPSPPRLRLGELLARPVRVLVKEHYSYGAYIDALLEKSAATRVSTTSENTAMVAMLKARRADLFFLSAEEAAYLAEAAGPGAAWLRILRFPDVPGGETRHVMCSMDVPQSAMDRLDREIVQHRAPGS